MTWMAGVKENDNSLMIGRRVIFPEEELITSLAKSTLNSTCDISSSTSIVKVWRLILTGYWPFTKEAFPSMAPRSSWDRTMDRASSLSVTSWGTSIITFPSSSIGSLRITTAARITESATITVNKISHFFIIPLPSNFCELIYHTLLLSEVIPKNTFFKYIDSNQLRWATRARKPPFQG